MQIGKKLFKNLIKMSSKEQLTDYIKRLKKENAELKQKNRELSRHNLSLVNKLVYLEKDLEESKRKERKWYHLF